MFVCLLFFVCLSVVCLLSRYTGGILFVCLYVVCCCCCLLVLLLIWWGVVLVLVVRRGSIVVCLFLCCHGFIVLFVCFMILCQMKYFLFGRCLVHSRYVAFVCAFARTWNRNLNCHITTI